MPSAPPWRWLHPSFVLDRRAVLGLAVLLILATGYAVQHFWLGRPQPVPVPPAAIGDVPPDSPGTASSPPESTRQPTARSLVVDVAGKVQNPGLRTLPSGSRVADALRAAGGPVPGTDTDNLNLARLLTDGEQILVGTATPAGQSTPGGPLSLNHATADQLDALPGVGPTLAQRIVAYRDSHGPFRSVDQLRQISGIGQRKYDDLKPLVTL